MALRVRHANGVGLRFANTDNMDFKNVVAQQVGGSGDSIRVQAAMPGEAIGTLGIGYLTATGPSRVEAVAERPGSVTLGDLHVRTLDGGNNTPVPTGPNVVVDDTNYPNFATIGKTLVGLPVGNGVGNAAAARNWLNSHPEHTMVISNTSGGGLVWTTDRSGVFFQRVDGIANEFHLFGPGAYRVFAPFQAAGAVGFNGATPVGKCNLDAALPTDGSATTAAIVSAVNKVRSCLVTNGLAQ